MIVLAGTLLSMSEGLEKGWLLSQYGSLRGRDWRDTFQGGFPGFRQQLFRQSGNEVCSFLRFKRVC